MTRSYASFTSVALALGLAACGGGADGGAGEPIGEEASALTGPANNGKHFFDNALPHTNGRSCATCHVASQHLALAPADVEARLASDPDDPLFNPIDADDPSAATPSYEHLRAGLVRVHVPLAANLDLIDDAGNVVTGADRTIALWRAVPTIENTALSAPYLYDGRATTLQEQALGALHDHSQITHEPPGATLDHIAAFERTVFSSPGVKSVADALAAGTPPPDPDPAFAPGSAEAAGKVVFQRACVACHGGATGTQFTDQAVHDALFNQLNPDGTAKLITLPGGAQVPVPLAGHEDDGFANLGTAATRYLMQVPPQFGGIPNPSGLDFPHYRLRFYTDGTRTQKLMDLPPPAFDPQTGQPELGPNFFPQLFTVDPGRCVITGDPADFEAFDVPQLRGIAGSAPYFHDNLLPDLPSLVDFYSRFILPVIPPLGLPPINPSQGPGLPPESLSPTEKAQLVAYLKKI